MHAPPPHPLEPLRLDQPEPRQRGRAHGEHWRAEIQQLTETWRQRAHGPADSVDAGLAAAGAGLDALRELLPAPAEELLGIAEGADLSPARIALLNGLADWSEPVAPLTGNTLLYFNGERGPLLGLTWDLPPALEAHVRMLRIAPAGQDDEFLCLTLTGCLGSAGLSGRGVAVATADLSTLDGGAGVPWMALVRGLLAQPHAAAARRSLPAAGLAGGHYFLVADGHDYYGVEHGGQRAILTQLGPRAAHLHTNHLFDPVLRQRERMVAGSTSHYRLNLATTLYAQQRPRDAEGMWSLLHAQDGSPGSLSIDPSPQAEPARPVTCATMMMRLHDGFVRVVRGGEHRHPPLQLGVERWRGQPPPADPAGA